MTEAVRKLSNFDFTAEGCHVSLVDSAANGHTALIIKGKSQINKADVEVKLSLVSFLSNFFHMWTGEAATLATILGFDDEGWFDEDFTFEEFNSLGATEVKLLKSFKELSNSEDNLREQIDVLSVDDMSVLKTLSERIQPLLKEHKDMKEEIVKALAEQKATLELEAKTNLEAVQKSADDAKAALAVIEKANEASRVASYVEVAKSLGAEKADDFGKALASVATTEDGLTVIKALEASHKALTGSLENEEGFSGDAGDVTEETGIMKAMEAKYKTENK